MLIEPLNEDELAQAVLAARAEKLPLSIEGGATRVSLGRPSQTARTLSTRKLTGITLYEPSEMIIAARAGTPLREVEDMLRVKGQMLAFEPMDHRTLLGTGGEPTLGAVAATNISGPRRISAGAARDSLIGLRFVNGRGEIIKNGGRVMKNVTGLDLVKLLAGSFGTLAAFTEVTFKVLPIPETSATLSFKGLEDSQAIAAMTMAIGSPYEITGAAHLTSGLGRDISRCFLRIEGFTDSVEYRLAELRKLLAEFGTPNDLRGEDANRLWRGIRDVEFLAEPRDSAIWRIHAKPTDASRIVEVCQSALAFRHFYDWGGGLIWLACDAAGDAGEAIIRQATRKFGGHARLERGPVELRAAQPVFEPLDEKIMQLTVGIKKSFDPDGILNPGRMYAGI